MSIPQATTTPPRVTTGHKTFFFSDTGVVRSSGLGRSVTSLSVRRLLSNVVPKPPEVTSGHFKVCIRNAILRAA